MSTLRNVFSNSRRSGDQRYGNVFLKVEAIDPQAQVDKAYMGTISGTIVGGVHDGTEVTAAIRTALGNSNTPKVANFVDPSDKSYITPGCYLSLEGAEKVGKVLMARWANKMGGPDAELVLNKPVRIAPATDRKGNVRRFGTGATMYNAHILHMDGAVACTSEDTLRAGIAGALEARGGVMLVALVPEGDSLSRASAFAWRKVEEGGEPAELGVSVEEVYEGIGPAEVDAIFAEGGKIDVVPVETVRLGRKVSQEVDKGNSSAIDVSRFKMGGKGARVEAALKGMAPEQVDAVKRQFLSFASADVAETFGAEGWKGISDEALKEFFAQAEVALPPASGHSYAYANLVMQHYKDENGQRTASRFVTKGRTTSNPVPRDAIATPSDEGAAKRYYESFKSAVSGMAAIDAAGPSRSVTNDASPAAASSVSAPVDEPQVGEVQLAGPAVIHTGGTEADIDQLLDEIADDHMAL